MTTDDDFEARAQALMAAEDEEGLYWLSFADESGFLGAALVPASGPVTAGRMAWMLGCNPGGQMASWGPLPTDFAAAVDQMWVGRLLSKADCARFDEEMEAR